MIIFRTIGAFAVFVIFLGLVAVSGVAALIAKGA